MAVRPASLSLPGQASAAMRIAVTPASDEDEEGAPPSSHGSLVGSGSEDGGKTQEKRKVRRRSGQRNRSASIAVPDLELRSAVSDSEVFVDLQDKATRRRELRPRALSPQPRSFSRRGSDVDERSDGEASGGLAASIAAFKLMRQRRASISSSSPTQETASFDFDELVGRIRAKETIEFEVSFTFFSFAEDGVTS